MPEPTVEPWMWTVVRSATSASTRPALRCSRTRCAVAGSGRVPNSSRSPPLQKESPAPRRTTEVTEGSATATCRADTSSSRMAASKAFSTWGRWRVMDSSAPWRSTNTGGPSPAGRSRLGAPRRHAANSGPDWSSP